MSKPANKTVIGLFVVGAVGLAVLALVVLGSGKFFTRTIPYVMYFEGSVKGLSVGAPVIFRGVKIATVAAIRMHLDTKDLSVRIPVYVEFGGEGEAQEIGFEKEREEMRRVGKQAHHEFMKKMIERGLRAQLDMQSFVTGQLQIALELMPDKPAKFVGGDPKTPEIPTVPTALQALLKKLENLPLEDIVKDASSAIKGIDRVVNSPEIMQTVRSISQAAEEARQLVHNVDAKVEPVLSGLEGAVGDARRMIEDVQKLAQNVNDQVQPLSSQAQETLKDAQTLVRNVDGQIDPVAISLKSTLASIQKASDEAGVTLQQAQQVLKSVEGDGGESELIYEFNQALKNVRALSKAIRDLADTLDRQPESAIFGKKNLNRGGNP